MLYFISYAMERYFKFVFNFKRTQTKVLWAVQSIILIIRILPKLAKFHPLKHRVSASIVQVCSRCLNAVLLPLISKQNITSSARRCKLTSEKCNDIEISFILGLCRGTLHFGPRNARGKAAVDLLPLRPGPGWVHLQGGDGGHRGLRL